MQELLLRHLYTHTPFGWGGWDDNVPWTCTHTGVRVVGGWGGWDDNVLGLAHIVVYGCGGMGGVGGMITYLDLHT